MIWAFVDVLGRRLVLWAVVSVLAGLPLLAWGDAFWGGVGLMFVAWGAIDGAIGAVARGAAARGRRTSRGDPAAPSRETRRVRRLLWLNAGLDVAYIGGGAWLLVTAGDPFWAGAGLGIVLQGAFLLAFDVVHARWVPSPAPILPEDLALFTGPEHEPFRLSAVPAGEADPGQGRPPRDAALLVHGFGGTPAEMRALAALLAARGWVVEVPLLPGMGAAIRELPDVRLEDWTDEVMQAAARLRQDAPGRMLVVGHSMGAALALAVTARLRPDALVLLAPFWWPEPAWLRPLGPLIRTLLPPGIRPFRRLDLDGHDVREGMSAALPGMDIDDPQVRAALRDLVVPVSIFEQLFRASRAAIAAARTCRTPALVVQGLADEVSRPDRTRRLVAAFPAPRPRLIEVASGHGLITEVSPSRDETLAAVLAFADEVRGGSRAGAA